MTHQLPSLEEVDASLRVLQRLVPNLEYPNALLIQLDSEDVSIFSSKSWRSSDFFVESVPAKNLITCAGLSDVYDNPYSLPAQLKKLASRIEYADTVEKAKSFGLTDEEIQILQKDNN
jgi:hypothetical protein